MLRVALIVVVVACGKSDPPKPAPPTPKSITFAGHTLAVPAGFTTEAEFADKELVAAFHKLLGAGATILIATTPPATSVIGFSLAKGSIATTDAECASIAKGLGEQVAVPVKGQVFASPKPSGCVFSFTRPKLAPEVLYYLVAPNDQHIVLECTGAKGEDQTARDIECGDFAHELGTTK